MVAAIRHASSRQSNSAQFRFFFGAGTPCVARPVTWSCNFSRRRRWQLTLFQVIRVSAFQGKFFNDFSRACGGAHALQSVDPDSATSNASFALDASMTA